MSYACIDRDEVARRGLCEGAATQPLIIREVLVRPVRELAFNSVTLPPATGFRHAPMRISRPRGRGRPRQALGRASYAPPVPPSISGRRMAPPAAQGCQGPSTAYTSRPAAPVTPGAIYDASPPTYTATPARQQFQTVIGPSMTYASRQAAAEPAQTAYRPSARYPEAPEAPMSRRPFRAPVSGLGQAADVSPRWKWATFGLVGLVVAQFFWWDARAPQVLRGGGY